MKAAAHELVWPVVRADRAPWITLGVACLALVAAAGGTEAMFIYDRSRVLAGEVWRLWTGNLVHFGLPHTVVDIGLFVILGRLLEWSNRRLVVLSLILIPPCVTGAILLFDPQMSTYGGLSGLNLGWLVILALRGWQRAWTDWFWPAVIVLYVAEVVQEAWLGHGMVRFDDPSIRVATWAHIGGGAAAVALVVLDRRRAAENQVNVAWSAVRAAAVRIRRALPGQPEAMR